MECLKALALDLVNGLLIGQGLIHKLLETLLSEFNDPGLKDIGRFYGLAGPSDVAQ